MEYIEHKLRETHLLRQKYLENKPFPHIVLDNFINEDILNKVEEEFPDLASLKNKITYNNQKEIKFASIGSSDFSSTANKLINYLNSDVFLIFLQNLTGIKETLISDPYFSGAGYHEIERGGLLKVHADFNKHETMNLDRRLNLLLYLNKDWDPSWGGSLELYSKNDLKKPAVSIEPYFNRCVIFSTNSETFHGHPNEIVCPENRSRKSIALYYFSSGRPQHESENKHGTKFIAVKGEKFKLDLKSFISYWFFSEGVKKVLRKFLRKK